MLAVRHRLSLPLRAPALRPQAIDSPSAWLTAAVLFALVWTGLFLRQNNLEMQSIDLVHHAMFVDHLRVPWGVADPAFVGTYPLLSHRLAAFAMPVFENAIMAVRAAALASLLAIFIAQWFLLRTLLNPAAALLVLAAWQTLCTHCKLGNVNHFLWEFQFNYSRAVSAAAFWFMLLALARPPFTSRWLNLGLLAALAAFAFACHIAPGTLAFGALAAWCGVLIVQRREREAAAGCCALILAAALVLLGTDGWRSMAHAASATAPLPIRHPDLLALWLPVAAIAAGIVLRDLHRGGWRMAPLPTAILCGLLPAAVLQAYMLYRKNVSGTISSYPYNQMLMYTFGLASLWLIVLAVERLRPLIAVVPGRGLRLAAGAVAGVSAFVLLETDARRPRSGCDPAAVLADLRPLRQQFLGHYYYDPDWEHASYYITRCVLQGDAPHAADMRNLIHHRRAWELFAREDLHGVFLPGHLAPAAVIGPSCPAERVGPFWKCDLVAYRKLPEFPARLAREAQP